MTFAVAVAAGLLGGAIDNPAVLLVPAAVQTRATALVTQLGDRQFSEREAAARDLDDLGRLALPAVRAGRRSADAEIRRRCDHLAPSMEAAELAARLRVFVADAAGRYDHAVPGWELFRAAAGSDTAARELFAAAVLDRENWPLLAALRGPGVDVRAGLLGAAGGLGAWADRPTPATAARAAGVRRREFFDRSEPPHGLDDDELGRHKPRPLGVPEMTLVVLAETLHPERLTGRTGYQKDVNSFFGTTTGDTALRGKGPFGPAFARLGRVWFDTRDGPGVLHAYSRAKRLEWDAATVRRYAARLVGHRPIGGEARAEAALYLASEAATDHAGAVIGQIDDADPLGGGQVRDLMLLAAVQLTGQRAADYGLGAAGLGGLFQPPADTKPADWGKVTEAQRAAAFARWRDWEATRFGAVAGPLGAVARTAR